MDLSEAIDVHLAWRSRLRAAINQRWRVDAATLARDDACALGKWLHGDARDRYSGLSSYARCVAEHARFHHQAGMVADAINAREYDKADAMIEMSTGYSAASDSAIAALKALASEADLQPGGREVRP